MFNVDASWCDESQEGAVAGVCRDYRGLLRGGFTKKIHAPSALLGKTLAVREGLSCVERTWEKRKLETDLRSVQTDLRAVITSDS